MKQLAQAQSATQPQSTSVNAINSTSTSHRTNRKCKYCGSRHAFKPRENCPAYGSTCDKCGKQNHWAKVCRSRPSSPGKYGEKSQYRHKKSSHKGQRKGIHMVQQQMQNMDSSSDTSDGPFEQISFAEVTVQSSENGEGDEIYAKVNIKLPGRRRVHTDLKVKVDTGAQGNIIPIRMYRKMCPGNIDSDGKPVQGTLKKRNTILTAYNGTQIPHFGVLSIPCQYGEEAWRKVDFYIAVTEGPAILGLPTITDLKLVSLNCAIEMHTPISSTAELVQMFPEQFDRIGKFQGRYHIVLDSDAQPIIHAPRKCPIQLKEELKKELEKMVQQEVIRKVNEPTDWVNSLAYSRKDNGSLRICLDPKDLK